MGIIGTARRRLLAILATGRSEAIKIECHAIGRTCQGQEPKLENDTCLITVRFESSATNRRTAVLF